MIEFVIYTAAPIIAVYLLRRYIFYYVIRMALAILYYKIKYTTVSKKRKEYEFEVLNEIRLDEDKTLYEVACYIGTKSFTISFVGNGSSHEEVSQAVQKLVHNDGDVTTVMEKRSCIVYCGLSTSEGDFLCDLTEIFRRFVFYFEHDEENPGLLDYFLSYVKRMYPNIDEVATILEVHKNDDNFTEVRLPLIELYGKTFADILS